MTSDQLLTPADVENRLHELSGLIDEAHDQLVEAEMTYHKAEAEYELELARATILTGGRSADMRKAEATLDCERERKAQGAGGRHPFWEPRWYDDENCCEALAQARQLGGDLGSHYHCSECWEETSMLGHVTTWCKVTRGQRERHRCCPGNCELEAQRLVPVSDSLEETQ